MKPTKDEKKIIRRYKMIPFFWTVITNRESHLLVINIFSGEYRVLDK